MLGNLYIIRNTVNDKVYIGKTYKTIKRRFVEHKKEVKRGTKYKLYNAMRKYGIDKFYIELIARFEEGILEEKEIEYIAKYDSYHNGYNSTLGGEGYKRRVFNEEEILNDWESGLSIAKIAKKNGAATETISYFLTSKGVYTFDAAKSEKIKLIIYDEYWERIKVFNSRKESVDYIKNELKMSVPHEVCQKIDNACKNGNIAYKHHWQRVDELFIDDMEFNTIWDKEDYINGEEIKLVNGVYWSLLRINKIKELKEKEIEKINTIKKREEYKNKKQENKFNKSNGKPVKFLIEIRNEVPIRTIEIIISELVALLKSHDVEIVAKKYNVTSKTIRKMCRDAGVGTPSSIRKQYIIEENTKKVLDYYNAGKGTFTISKLLGISEGIVLEIINLNKSIVRGKINTPIKVMKFDLDGNYIETFNSMSEAARACGKNAESYHIAECIDGKRKMAYGYAWKKVE